MTAIAYDGQTIAADSLESLTNGERCPTPVNKISLVRAKMRGAMKAERLIVAGSGSLHHGLTLFRHYLFAERTLGQLPPISLNESATLLIIHLDRGPDGALLSARKLANIPAWQRPAYSCCKDGGIISVLGAKFAIGSGADYARGAMEAGKSASLAVEIAIRLDTGCGGPVDCIEIGDAVRNDTTRTSHPITE